MPIDLTAGLAALACTTAGYFGGLIHTEFSGRVRNLRRRLRAYDELVAKRDAECAALAAERDQLEEVRLELAQRAFDAGIRNGELFSELAGYKTREQHTSEKRRKAGRLGAAKTNAVKAVKRAKVQADTLHALAASPPPPREQVVAGVRAARKAKKSWGGAAL